MAWCADRIKQVLATDSRHPDGLMVQPPAEARWMVYETTGLFFTFMQAGMRSWHAGSEIYTERRRDVEQTK
jgi:hypothetical protein